MTSTVPIQSSETNAGASPVIDLTDQLVLDLTTMLGPRLDEVSLDELEAKVRVALDELAPVRVTTYLGVLVERSVRASLPRQRSASAPASA
jgi:hypothetical protein